MSQKNFYVAAFVGLVVSGAILYFLEYVPLGRVIAILIVTALFVVLVGRWRKKRGPDRPYNSNDK